MSDALFIIETTLGSLDSATAMSKRLVEEGSVVCCHSIPISSCYRWQGKIEVSEEVLLRCKTIKERVEDVILSIRKDHPYAVPEIIVTEATSVHQPYTKWVQEAVSKGGVKNESF
jgi:periplasmic divalent cation tolerance protein